MVYEDKIIFRISVLIRIKYP